MTALPPELASALSGRYRLMGEAEVGGMAQVYRATDLKHGREVAIKVVRPELATQLGAERFDREIAIAARLNHPHLVPLFDSGIVGDHRYFVMPFVQGESLRRRLDRDGRIAPAEALRVVRDVATGLAHAHAAGVLHRDIKPENILLVGGSAMLADFGVAMPLVASQNRLTAAGMPVGTLLYMSPEQLSGDHDLDQRSDLYSLGAVLFEMVTGSRPHDPSTPAELLGRRLRGPPAELTAPDGVPDVTRPVLQGLLGVEPETRFDSADALVRVLDSSAQPALPLRRSASRYQLAGAAALAIVVLVVVAVFVMRNLGERLGGGDRPGSPLNRVAILPFTNLGPDAGNEYFSDGLGEELIHTLSRVEELQVVPRTSSWVYRGRNLDVRVLGDSLRAGSIVEGSVRWAGGRLRVRARLVRTADGQSLWTGEFDQKSRTDIFAIQDSITAAIVGAIRTRLVQPASANPNSAPSRPPVSSAGGQAGLVEATPRYFRTQSVEAHDSYLRARFEWHRRNSESALRSVDLFRRSISYDSTYVAAWAGLAEALAVAAFYEWLPPSDAFPEARRMARRALDLEPDAGEPHATLGYVALWYDWDIPAAEVDFQRSIALRPRYAQAHQWYANLLTAAGRFDEALAAWRRAVALEPLAMILLAGPGWSEYYAGRPERTVAIERDVIARDPSFALGHYWLGLGLEALGDHDGAIVAHRRSAALTNNGPLARTGIAHAFAASGHADSALGIVRELEAQLRTRPAPAFEMATVYLALGDTRRALGWLGRAATARSHSIALAPIDPRLAPLRGLARFERLVEAVRRQ